MNIWTLFWGGFFVMLGLSIILKGFGVNVQFFKIAFAVFVILVGIKILLPDLFNGGAFNRPGNMSFCGGETVIAGKDVAGPYKVSFGSARMDLTEIDMTKGTVKVKLNNSFGQTTVMIGRTQPVLISISSSFGEVKLPDGNGLSGANVNNLVYKNAAYKDGGPCIELNIDNSFGEVVVLNKE